MLRPFALAPRLVLAAGALLMAAACTPTASGPAPETAQTRPETGPGTVDPRATVIVALLAPTGAADPETAAVGQALANAGRMAAVDIADPALELRVYDTAGTPEGAAAAAGQALAEGAALILGPLFSAETGAVAAPAAAAGINVISFSTDSSVAGAPVWLSGFLPEVEAERIVRFAAQQGRNRIGVFYPATSYGDAALRGADSVTDWTSARVVTTATYPRTFQGIQDNSGPFAEAAQAAGVDAILLPEFGQGLRSVGAFMDYAGLDPAEVKYLGLGQWNSGVTLQEPALKGGWFPAPDPDRLDRFAGLYAARYAVRPPFVAVLGYDVVQVAGQALAAARIEGSYRPFSAEALTRRQGFQGALGPLRFEPDGRNHRAMAILEVAPGRFEVIDPAPGFLGAGS